MGRIAFWSLSIGYMGACPPYCLCCPRYCLCPGWHGARVDQVEMRGRIRMRHEHINKHMKNFGCLLNRFRSNTTKHSSCFRAVAALTQVSITSGEPMMDVSEYDDRMSDLEIGQHYGL